MAAPDTKAAAQADLATLAPNAQLTWRDDRGTLSAIDSFDLPLPECTGDQDVSVIVRQILTDHPALFQLDLSEWNNEQPRSCASINENISLFNLTRLKYKDYTAAGDTFGWSVIREKGVVVLKAVYASYLPIKLDGIGSTLDACNKVSEAQIMGVATAGTLPFRSYEGICHPIGDHTYQPQANDTFKMEDTTFWEWNDGTGDVVFTGSRVLIITIDPANVTPELIHSDAECPGTDPNGPAHTYGFEVIFDVNTGEIISSKPGLGCFVC